MQTADICRANKDTFGEVRTFYHSLIDNLNPERRYVGWKKDIYPSPEFLRTSIDNSCLYICRDKERIAGAMVLNHEYNESYQNCRWHIAADDSELLVIHALGVHPDFHRKGYAKALVRHSIAIAREAGMKTIRLDVLDGNIPAETLYLGMGFQYLNKVQMYYEDTGWTAFRLYEYVL